LLGSSLATPATPLEPASSPSSSPSFSDSERRGARSRQADAVTSSDRDRPPSAGTHTLGLSSEQPRYDGAEQIRGSLRRRSARIVFDKGLGHRPLVHDYEPLVPGDHPLELLLFVTGINGETVVL
jgi:hypothetical protein